MPLSTTGYDITTPYGEVNVGFFDGTDSGLIEMSIFPMESEERDTHYKCEDYVKEVIGSFHSELEGLNWERDSGGSGLLLVEIPVETYGFVCFLLRCRGDTSLSHCRAV